MEGLQTLKPQARKGTNLQPVLPANGVKGSLEMTGGINVEAHIVTSADDANEDMVNWVVENVKLSVKQPVSISLNFPSIDALSFFFVLL